MSATDRLIDPNQVQETKNYRVYSLNGGVKVEKIVDDQAIKR